MPIKVLPKIEVQGCVCGFVLSVLNLHVCKSSKSPCRSLALSISQPQLSHTGAGTVSYRTHTEHI